MSDARVQQDQAYIYTGFDSLDGAANPIDADIGFQFGTDGNPGWKVCVLQKPQANAARRFTLTRYNNIWVTGEPVIDLLLPNTSDRQAEKHVFFIVRADPGGAFAYVDPTLVNPPNPTYCYSIYQEGMTNTAYQGVLLKRMNSIGQKIKTQRGTVAHPIWAGLGAIPNSQYLGLYEDDAFVNAAEWGGLQDPDTGGDYYVTVDLNQLTEGVNTYRQGSYQNGTNQNGPFVSWAPANKWFWEYSINIKTTP